ncbi:MAG: hypothetical protein HY741_11285 [Chloroflexi bacterium]|nr:hypothetical protein [Chloroflexota bacterium]
MTTLTEATVQDVQLELIRRLNYNALDGERVVKDLLAHRELWRAAMIDRFCFSRPGKLPALGLLKLRDLPDNFWNADTLYVLTPNSESAHKLAQLAEEWGGMVLVHKDREDIESALGGYGYDAAIVSVWWD